MAEPFLGEIRMVGFNFAPRGWAFCDGQILPINQNQSLYSLYGTTFGGDGRTSFALPDLRGRTPIHPGGSFTQGQKGGTETVTLTVAQLAAHEHAFNASSSTATLNAPTSNSVFGASDGTNLYTGASNLTAMNGNMIANTGGSQAHYNLQPTLVISFCVALQGLFPSRN